MIIKYQEFIEKIKNTISESQLDIGIIYFILKNLMRDIEDLYYQELNQELSSIEFSEKDLKIKGDL